MSQVTTSNMVTKKTTAQTKTSGKEQPRSGGRVQFNINQFTDRLPPHADLAERALLGAMILDHQVIGEVLQYVKSRHDFYLPKHGEIFDALRSLYDTKNAGDEAMLFQLLEDRKVAEDIGGKSYLVELAQSAAIAQNAVYYAETVAKKATLRKMIHAAGEIMQSAYADPEEVSDVLDIAQTTIFEVLHEADHHDAESLSSLLKQAMELIQSRDQGEVITGLETGFRDLDEITSGLQPSEMIIIAARPSMGKTALALNLAEWVAMDGNAVGLFSLEMSRQQLAQRLLCSYSEVDSHRLRRNMINKDDYWRLGKAVGELSKAPIYIDDSPGLSVLELRAKARRMALQYDIKLILVDYLQLLRGSSKESRQQEVAEISRGIKALARELNIPVVCLSQLNRASENREDHRPRMSDLRESGSIEQDADAVMMLHREEYFHNGDPEWTEAHPEKVGLAELIIAKQRNGPTGTVKLTWVPESTKFKDHFEGNNGYGSTSWNGPSVPEVPPTPTPDSPPTRATDPAPF